jgi:hypothetical protein
VRLRTLALLLLTLAPFWTAGGAFAHPSGAVQGAVHAGAAAGEHLAGPRHEGPEHSEERHRHPCPGVCLCHAPGLPLPEGDAGWTCIAADAGHAPAPAFHHESLPDPPPHLLPFPNAPPRER